MSGRGENGAAEGGGQLDEAFQAPLSLGSETSWPQPVRLCPLWAAKIDQRSTKLTRRECLSVPFGQTMA